MSERLASLPMYDADRAAVEAWWRALADLLAASGMRDLPASLRWPADLEVHWHDPRLLLSQMCGYPLVTEFIGEVQVVGAFRYDVIGCEGIGYRSELLARSDDALAIEDFRGRIAAINSHRSHSGSNALRGLVAPLAKGGAFFGGERLTGSHRASMRALQAGTADIAAIDCVTLAAILRREPDAMAGLRRIGATPSAPGLPLVTSPSTSGEDLQRLRQALAAACAAPALAQVRNALFIGGFEVVDVSAWGVIDRTRRSAEVVFGKVAST